jgi:hypothetical protein
VHINLKISITFCKDVEGGPRAGSCLAGLICGIAGLVLWLVTCLFNCYKLSSDHMIKSCLPWTAKAMCKALGQDITAIAGSGVTLACCTFQCLYKWCIGKEDPADAFKSAVTGDIEMTSKMVTDNPIFGAI